MPVSLDKAAHFRGLRLDGGLPLSFSTCSCKKKGEWLVSMGSLGLPGRVVQARTVIFTVNGPRCADSKSSEEAVGCWSLLFSLVSCTMMSGRSWSVMRGAVVAKGWVGGWGRDVKSVCLAPTLCHLSYHHHLSLKRVREGLGCQRASQGYWHGAKRMPFRLTPG